MTLTDDQSAQLTKLARPLVEWLRQNANPHCTVLIDQTSAELVEGVTGIHYPPHEDES